MTTNLILLIFVQCFNFIQNPNQKSAVTFFISFNSSSQHIRTLTFKVVPFRWKAMSISFIISNYNNMIGLTHFNESYDSTLTICYCKLYI